MTVTSIGYKGQVSDADFAAIVANLGSWVESPADLAVTAVAGARQVSVATGYAVAPGVRVRNDAALPSPVWPVPNAGQWYLVGIDRNWDPATRASSIVFLTGPTTATTAVPVFAPKVAPVLGWYTNPGVRAVQPLAWAWVRSTDATVTLFDLRVRRTRAGLLRAPSIHALAVLNALSQFEDGAQVSVGQFAMPFLNSHDLSHWSRLNGVFYQHGRIFCSQGTAPAAPDTYNFGTNLSAFADNYSGLIGLTQTVGGGPQDGDSSYFETAAGVMLRFVGVGAGEGGFGWNAVPGTRTAATLTWNASADQTMVKGNWTDVVFDTKQLDPLGMLQPNNLDIKIPYSGRYSFDVRLAVTNTFGGCRYLLCISDLVTDRIWQGGPQGVLADTPFTLSGEVFLYAGANVRVRIYNDQATYQNWVRNGSNEMLRPTVRIRYLGDS